MKRALTGIALLAALGACGKKAPDGANVSIANVNLEVETGSAACNDRPSHAPLYPDAKIVTCTSGAITATSKVSGTIVYESAAPPAVILAWSREQAARAKLTEAMASDAMLSAADGDRTVMVLVQPQGSGSQVTVNWGKAP